jgi:hypothetical protein
MFYSFVELFLAEGKSKYIMMDLQCFFLWVKGFQIKQIGLYDDLG